MRKLSFIFFGMLPLLGLAQATFQSKTGNRVWNNSSDWSLVSGSDADGIPDADDQVLLIRGSKMSLNAHAQCNALLFRMDLGTNGGTAELNIPGGQELLVLGSVTANHNGSGNGGNASEQTLISIAGSLRINQNLLLTNNSDGGNTGVPGNISINNSGLISIGDSLAVYNKSVDGAIIINNTQDFITGAAFFACENKASNLFTGSLICNRNLYLECKSSNTGNNGSNQIILNRASAVNGSCFLSTQSYSGLNLLELRAAFTCQDLSIISGSTAGTADLDNLVIVGRQGSQATLQCQNFSMSAQFGSNILRNQIQFNSGTWSINGEFRLSGASTSRNLISINNQTADGLGLAKTLNFKGPIVRNLSGALLFQNLNADASFTCNIEGSGKRSLPASNQWMYQDLNLKTSDTIELEGELSIAANSIRGLLSVFSGSTLSDRGFACTPAALQLQSQSAYVASAPGSSFPSGINQLMVGDQVDLSYVNNTGNAMDIVGFSPNQVMFQNIHLRGFGVKRLINPIGGQIKTKSLIVWEGALALGSYNIALSASPASLIVKDQGLIDFSGSGTLAYGTNCEFSRLSGVRYSGGDQNIGNFLAISGMPAEIGSLYLAGNGVKSSIANLRIRGVLDIGSNTTLSIANNTYITLVSNAQGSAWVSEVKGSIDYNESGAFIVQKYFDLGNYRARYRDFCSPVKNTTLRNWARAGFVFYGFPGSTFPNTIVADFFYNENKPGDMNLGFTGVQSLDETIVKNNGNQIEHGGLRMFFGRTVTLADTGQIFTGTVNQKLHYTDVSDYKFDNGWNLVVNPYPCALDFDKIANDPDNATIFYDKKCNGEGLEKRGVGANYIQWMPFDNNKGNVSEAYSYYNAYTGMSWFPAGGSRINNIIPAFGSFWLKADSKKDLEEWNLSIKESHKATGHGKFYKGADVQHLLTRFSLSSASHFAELGMYQWECADVNFDAYDIEGTGTSGGNQLIFRFYDEKEGIMDLWVNAISNKGKAIAQKMWVQFPKSGSYTFSSSNLQALLQGFDCALLYDSVSNIFTDLKSTGQYIFQADSGSSIRFTLYLNPAKKTNTFKSALSLDQALSLPDCAPLFGLNPEPLLKISQSNGTYSVMKKDQVLQASKAQGDCSGIAAAIKFKTLDPTVNMQYLGLDANNKHKLNFSATNQSSYWIQGFDESGYLNLSSIAIDGSLSNLACTSIAVDQAVSCKKYTKHQLNLEPILPDTEVQLWSTKGEIQYDIHAEKIDRISVYSVDGKLISDIFAPVLRGVIPTNGNTGIFLVHITVNGKPETHKLWVKD